ncbi:hypothetical protein HOI71_27035, partial [Candidatus Poribacteria bacterium]|nr:hypothetical protein [Candidatus Poribacteria bacterium]
MRGHVLAGYLAPVVAALLAIGCGSAAPPHRRPIKPLAAYEGSYADIVVDTETQPEPTLELTRDGVTVRVQYWPKGDLDRKFTRGGETSAFHFEPSWPAHSRVDVWHVTVSHAHDKPVRIKLADVDTVRVFIEDNQRMRADMDPNYYYAMTEAENRARLEAKRGLRRDTEAGLRTVNPLLFERNLTGDQVPPGITVSGYLPFQAVKPNANDIWLHIPVETPPGSDGGAYRTVDFVFPYE